MQTRRSRDRRGRGRRRRSTIQAIGLVLALALPALLPGARSSAAAPSSPAQGPLFASLTVLVGSYEVTGQLAATGPDAGDEAAPWQLEAELLDAEGWTRGRTAARTGEDGSVELRFEARGSSGFRPLRIRPGDRLAMRLPRAGRAASLTLTVPPLSTEIDAATGVVSGRAPAGARVFLTAFDARDRFAREQVLAGPDGRYAHPLGETLPLGPGAHGSALVLDGSTAYQAAWALPAPELRIGSPELDLRVRPGEIVRARLYDAAGRPSARAEGWARDGRPRLVLRGTDGSRRPLLPGDRLRVDFDAGDPEWAAPRPPVALEVPDLLAELDPVAQRLAGQTRPRERLSVTLDGERFELQAGDRYGHFSLALPEGLDLAVGLQLGFPDRPGLRAVVRPARLLERHPRRAWLAGTALAGARASLRILGADGAPRGEAEARVGADGRFELGLRAAADGELLALAPDDRLELRILGYDAARGQGAWRETRLLQAELGAVVDSDADGVAGVAAAGEQILVRLPRGGQQLETVAAGDGAWSVDFRGRAEILPGDLARIEARDPASGSRRELAPRAFRALPQANGERLRIEGHAGLEARVELEREGRVLAGGSCRIPQDASACETLLRDAAGQPLWIAAGDLLVASAAGLGTVAVDLVEMTAHIDARGRDVVGVAPAEDEVSIRFFNDQGDGLPLDTGAGTDENGVYDHELTASEWDQLVPGLMAEVRYRRPRGQAQLALGLIEQLRVRLGDPELQVLAEPGTRVTATLEIGEPREWSAIEEASAAVPGDGRPSLRLPRLRDPATTPRRVRLEHARGQILLPLGRLEVWPLDRSGALTGLGQPFARVRAYHHLPPGAAPPWLAVTGEVGADGRFELPAPDVDPAAVRAIEVVLYAGGGAELARLVDRGASIRRLHLPLAWR